MKVQRLKRAPTSSWWARYCLPRRLRKSWPRSQLKSRRCWKLEWGHAWFLRRRIESACRSPYSWHYLSAPTWLERSAPTKSSRKCTSSRRVQGHQQAGWMRVSACLGTREIARSSELQVIRTLIQLAHGPCQTVQSRRPSCSTRVHDHAPCIVRSIDTFLAL